MMRRSAALAALLLVAAADPPLPTRIVDGGFDAAEGAGAPTGWRLSARGSEVNVTAVAVVEGANRFVRLSARDPASPVPSRLQQTIDATPWRGKVVRLSARVRVASQGNFIGLAMDVRRPAPWSTGFHDNMYDRPIGAGDWRTVALTGFVEPDALTIDLGIAVAGAVALDLDDVTVDEAPREATPANAAASSYLSSAIDALEAKHFRTREIDWPALRKRASNEIAGAKQPADTYPAIRGVLGTLGDNHAALIPPRPAASGSGKAAAARTAPPPPLPSYRLVDGRFGMVSLPGLSMSSPADMLHARAYVATLREGLGIFAARPLCGWIVDLRANTGGNMWPMLNGLTPLLGTAPFGYFVDPDGKTYPWVLSKGLVGMAGEGNSYGLTPWRLRQADLPVAVLIGPRTSSSGEATAIAFGGRPRSRSFGQPSGGYTSANEGRTLSDGATLLIPSSWGRDRAGRDYREKIAPDEATPLGGEVVAARAWLAGQCG